MPVVSLDNTITLALSVRDRHASAEWYERVLGFRLLVHIDEAGWSEMQTNTTGVTLGLGEQLEPKPGNTVPVFGVADIGAARAALEAVGVKFDGKPRRSRGWSAPRRSTTQTAMPSCWLRTCRNNQERERLGG